MSPAWANLVFIPIFPFAGRQSVLHHANGLYLYSSTEFMYTYNIHKILKWILAQYVSSIIKKYYIMTSNICPLTYKISHTHTHTTRNNQIGT